MVYITITEALAEIKTISKRVGKKHQFVLDNLLRPEVVKDPLEKQGGTPKAIEQEMQAISDLESRLVKIRVAIQESNRYTMLKVENVERSITDWLAWRKEIAPHRQNFINGLRKHINANRANWFTKASRDQNDAAAVAGITVNYDETLLAREAEEIEKILGILDGQLSLKNATTTISI